MDKASDNNNKQRETHDFMNVESFSQLPFIRPTPVKEKPGAIRLFGKEFGGGGNETLITDDSDSAETNNNNNESSSKDDKKNINNEGSSVSGAAGESSRRFECHYCCRNFPTSQALGGHQNAHKRERQHAKRAHLQSAMVHDGAGGGDAHMYGLINYHHHHHRFGPSPASSQYPSWNSGSGAGARFYGAVAGAYPPTLPPQPINGSPLAMWRIPAAVSGGGGTVLPVFPGEEVRAPVMNYGGGGGRGGNRGFVYHHDTKPASVKEHVSLDLHL